MNSLLATIDFDNERLWLAVAVVVVVYLVVDKLLAVKHAIDTAQFKANQAGGVAAAIGFKLFDDLLHWAGAGNLKETRRVIREIWEKYCQDVRGPIRLAYDVFIATWEKLRVDKEYGGKVREHVVTQALGVESTDEFDMVIAKAADRLERIGWAKLAKAGTDWAARRWHSFGTNFRSLFDELMEEKGEKKIAMRVARPTLQVLWDDAEFRPQAEALIREFVAKADGPTTTSTK